MRTLFVLGTRPEGIKCLPVVFALEERGGETFVLSTRQHTEMLDEVFTLFGRGADLALPPLPEDRSLCELLSHILHHLPPVLARLSPDLVLVQGDTLSAFAGALSAFLLGIPVAHIEAGLRTGDVKNPFPEEAMRRMICPLSTLHFAPTEAARNHLLSEGCTEGVYLVGNTVADALTRFCPHSLHSSDEVLVTVHRRETLGATQRDIFRAISALAARHPECHFLFPMHKSPAVREGAKEILSPLPNLTLCEPLPIDVFYDRLAAARLVLTDSGGVTEEAALLGIPTAILRDTTERESELALPFVRLAGTRPRSILAVAEHLLSAFAPAPRLLHSSSPSARIAEILLSL